MSHHALTSLPAPLLWETPGTDSIADPVDTMLCSIQGIGLELVPNAVAGRGIILCEDADGSRVLAATTPNWGWPVTRFVLNRVIAKAKAEDASKVLFFVSGLVSRDAVEQAESLGITLIYPASEEGA